MSENYLNLIQQLLECPSGEEDAILEANQNLLDNTLVQNWLRVFPLEGICLKASICLDFNDYC